MLVARWSVPRRPLVVVRLFLRQQLQIRSFRRAASERACCFLRASSFEVRRTSLHKGGIRQWSCPNWPVRSEQWLMLIYHFTICNADRSDREEAGRMALRDDKAARAFGKAMIRDMISGEAAR